MNGRDLVRCGVTRFATSFLTLQIIEQAKENLRKFDESKWTRGNQTSLDVSETILNTHFWLSLEDLLKASEAVLKVLKIVDGDTNPNMAYLHGVFLEAKKAIMKNFEGDANVRRSITSLL